LSVFISTAERYLSLNNNFVIFLSAEVGV